MCCAYLLAGAAPEDPASDSGEYVSQLHGHLRYFAVCCAYLLHAFCCACATIIVSIFMSVPNRAPSCVSWEPQSRYLATGGSDGYLIVWDPLHGVAANVCTRAHGGSPITALAWAADGHRLVSCGGDNCVRVWRLLPPSATAGVLPSSPASS